MERECSGSPSLRARVSLTLAILTCSVVVSSLHALGFGLLGAIAGGAVLAGLSALLGPAEGLLANLAYTLVGGAAALVACFGTAHLCHRSEAPFFDALFEKIGRVAARRSS